MSSCNNDSNNEGQISNKCIIPDSISKELIVNRMFVEIEKSNLDVAIIETNVDKIMIQIDLLKAKKLKKLREMKIYWLTNYPYEIILPHHANWFYTMYNKLFNVNDLKISLLKIDNLNDEESIALSLKIRLKLKYFHSQSRIFLENLNELISKKNEQINFDMDLNIHQVENQHQYTISNSLPEVMDDLHPTTDTIYQYSIEEKQQIHDFLYNPDNHLKINLSDELIKKQNDYFSNKTIIMKSLIPKVRGLKYEMNQDNIAFNHGQCTLIGEEMIYIGIIWHGLLDVDAMRVVYKQMFPEDLEWERIDRIIPVGHKIYLIGCYNSISTCMTKHYIKGITNWVFSDRSIGLMHCDQYMGLTAEYVISFGPFDKNQFITYFDNLSKYNVNNKYNFNQPIENLTEGVEIIQQLTDMNDDTVVNDKAIIDEIIVEELFEV